MSGDHPADGRWLTDPTVAIVKTAPEYPAVSPYHPGARYPEAILPWVGPAENGVYAGVRTVLAQLAPGEGGAGAAGWNPLGGVVRPGDHVLLKPNLIRQCHQETDEWEQVITHGSVVRAVLDYALLAAGRTGRVTIADGPQTDSDFAAIRRRAGLDDMAALYVRRGYRVEVLDLRRDRWIENSGVIERRQSLPGDPAGYTTVDLGEDSAFRDYRLTGRFYGADYDLHETARFHSGGRHCYVLCRTPLDADVVINLPKLKTHKKVGVTLSLKNLVGINGYRNCLPHHTLGTPDAGGDEFAATGLRHKLQSRAVIAFKRALVARGGEGGHVFRLVKRGGRTAFGDTRRVVRSGNWHGNDTAWRMVLDLNKAFFYHAGDGRRRAGRRYVTIVDGVVGGEGDGPVAPAAKAAGVLVAGFNPVAVDTVCATLMGFDYRALPMLARAWEPARLPLVAFGPSAVRCVSNAEDWGGDLAALERAPHLGFRPHFGWTGRIERGSRPLSRVAPAADAPR